MNHAIAAAAPADAVTALMGTGVGTLASPPLRSIALYSPRRLQIFLSYGHDGFTSVSRYLYKLLQSRGHSVWFDEISLSAG
jgi:hypothetical protein